MVNSGIRTSLFSILPVEEEFDYFPCSTAKTSSASAAS
jgi:hypothetical protein